MTVRTSPSPPDQAADRSAMSAARALSEAPIRATTARASELSIHLKTLPPAFRTAVRRGPCLLPLPYCPVHDAVAGIIRDASPLFRA